MKIHVLKLKLRKLHKYIGFTFSLFILHLTITGILLTYPETFKIKEAYISNYFILKKYNMETHEEVYGIKDIEDQVITINNNVYINGKFIDKFYDEIVSLYYHKNESKVYVLSKSLIGIYILETFDQEIEIKDIISIQNIYDLNSIGLNLSSKEVLFKNDSQYFKIKENKLLKFLTNNNKIHIKWFNLSAVNKDLAKYYLQFHQGEGVSVTRVLTELHNGKFFGSIFTLILFISSLSLLFLTISSFIFATNLFKSKKK